MSDVGYNIQLSGGVDSSYITAVIKENLGHDLNTYSVEIPDEIYNEKAYQNIVTEKFKTSHHSFQFGPLPLNTFPIQFYISLSSFIS